LAFSTKILSQGREEHFLETERVLEPLLNFLLPRVSFLSSNVVDTVFLSCLKLIWSIIAEELQSFQTENPELNNYQKISFNSLLQVGARCLPKSPQQIPT